MSMSKPDPVYVTQPMMPPLGEFMPYLQEMWDRKQLTNGGPFHQQLEQALCDYLGVPFVSLFNNATTALVTGLQALGIQGEVITTPYSFVATAHSLLWNNIEPVFVDVDPATLNIDPDRIAAAITPRTTAIMPVHCYGYPCEVEAIARIADAAGLKVIYDAAHAFGVRRGGQSLLTHGDLSIVSFHATKVFNTFEGGAIICRDAATKQHIDRLKNFGFVDEVTVAGPGINGKMAEINAAFGLLQLKYVDTAIARRSEVAAYYRHELGSVPGITLLPQVADDEANFAYFPLQVGEAYPLSRDALYQQLKDNNILARRYFFPLISDFPMYCELPSASAANLPVAKAAADRILCLPQHPNLSADDLARVVGVIRQVGQP